MGIIIAKRDIFVGQNLRTGLKLKIKIAYKDYSYLCCTCNPVESNLYVIIFVSRRSRVLRISLYQNVSPIRYHMHASNTAWGNTGGLKCDWIRWRCLTVTISNAVAATLGIILNQPFSLPVSWSYNTHHAVFMPILMHVDYIIYLACMWYSRICVIAD